MESEAKQEVSLFQAALPILVLAALVVYGLILRPLVLDEPAYPLEIVFLVSAGFAVAELLFLGFGWKRIEQAILAKMMAALPAFFILFSIGLVIGSWMVCGTIPMMVYFGLQWVDPSWIYLFAFLVPAIFSILTGTSWGSAGAVGIVVVGIGQALGAHLGIVAGAVIGGAYFGDKMSPLSDTTNLAALAAEVDLFDHIRSMMVTTVPAAVLAAIAYLGLGFAYPPTSGLEDLATQRVFLDSLAAIFDFAPWLLLPPLIVLLGSLWKRPTVPTLALSTATATVLAILEQRFTLTSIFETLRDGFDLSMVTWLGEDVTTLPPEVAVLVERGGLYALIEPIVVALIVFVFIGALEPIRAMPRVIGQFFRLARGRVSTVLATLVATATTSALTGNQYATSFIVADALKSRYDALGISRQVLSRSLEDLGTMLESLVPWTPTTIFMVATLGVAYVEYAPWQLLSLLNLVIAPAVAILGIGYFDSVARGETIEGEESDG